LKGLIYFKLAKRRVARATSITKKFEVYGYAFMKIVSEI